MCELLFGLLFVAILLLVILVLSDWSSRIISVWCLIAFTVFLWSGLALSEGIAIVLKRMAYGLVVLATLGALLWFYAAIRRKKLLTMLGSGDILFTFAISPAFEVRQFLLFLIFSSIIALLLWPLFRRCQPDLPGIPFVSISGFCFSLVLTARLFGLQYAI